MLEVNLDHRAPDGLKRRAADGDRVSIACLPAIARLSFRAKAKTLAGRGEVAGFRVDGAMNSHVAGDGERASMRLGPDEWLFLCPEAESADIVAAVGVAMGEDPHSLVDVSHRNVAFGLTGSEAAAVLNAGCPIDLSDKAFPAGSATRTILGKSDIVLARTGAVIWRVECWRSFGAYVHAFLTDAARDFGRGAKD